MAYSHITTEFDCIEDFETEIRNAENRLKWLKAKKNLMEFLIGIEAEPDEILKIINTDFEDLNPENTTFFDDLNKTEQRFFRRLCEKIAELEGEEETVGTMFLGSDFPQ